MRRVWTLLAVNFLVLWSTVTISAQLNETEGNNTDPIPTSKCRDRNKYSDPPHFQLKACAECYRYLFPKSRSFMFYKDYYMVIVSKKDVNGTLVKNYKVVIPDIYNDTSKAEVCRSLDSEDCERWAACCRSAEECCDLQIRSSVPTEQGACPHTWDGFSCWGRAKPGQTVSRECPSFLEHANSLDRAFKTCTENGTWFKHTSGLEWTDYTQCLDISKHKLVTYISLVCEAASIALLIPAVVIFLYYRPLRKQHRIKLHVHLFISFILTGLIYVLWATIVVLNRVNTPKQQSIMHLNSPGCKFLYALTRYARTSNYVWVLCEGFYLHRLIVKTFEPPKKLLAYYIIGWGFPWLPVGIYSILRLYNSDKNCWVSHVKGIEWIIYSPNLACLLLNTFFLANILRILMTQLQSHPNEPNNFRKALKATFILIPLFGLQLILIIYRPPFNSVVSRPYEISAAIITHSQGFFVSLIFCFINGEVLTHLRKSWVTICGIRYSREKRYESTSTQMTVDFSSRSHVSRSSGSSNKNYIQMKAIDEANGNSRLYN